MTNNSVLIVANYKEGRGGISGVVENHLTHLKKEGVEVGLFNTKTNPIKRLFLLFALLPKVHKCTVVHVHGCSYGGFYPIILTIVCAKIISKKRTIVTYHGGGAGNFLRHWKSLVKFFLNKADHVTVMSTFLQNVFSSYGVKTIIVRNIVDVKSDAIQQRDFSVPKIISTRSFYKIYNVPDIIKAFKLCEKEYPQSILQIIGDGDQIVEIKNSIKGYNRIKYHGLVKQSKVYDLLSESNIFVSVPSIDNQPMSVLEAFSSGCIVIASNVGGVSDMIHDKVNGLLVEPNRPDQIFDTIKWIINNQKLAQDICYAGFKELNRYSWESIRSILYELYDFIALPFNHT
ncbi:MAG: glycosyltransferase family 4 protein [bacterium]